MRVDLHLSLALLVSPNIIGGYTFAVIDDVTHSRVIEKHFPDEQRARSEGPTIAEQYALTQVREAFAKALLDQ